MCPIFAISINSQVLLLLQEQLSEQLKKLEERKQTIDTRAVRFPSLTLSLHTHWFIILLTHSFVHWLFQAELKEHYAQCQRRVEDLQLDVVTSPEELEAVRRHNKSCLVFSFSCRKLHWLTNKKKRLRVIVTMLFNWCQNGSRLLREHKRSHRYESCVMVICSLIYMCCYCRLLPVLVKRPTN